MSNLFYNRYIPPPNVQQVDNGADTILDQPRKRPKKAKPTDPDEPAAEDSRHKKLRLKYEKVKKPARPETQHQDGNLNHAEKGAESEVHKKYPESHGLVPIPQPAPAPQAPKPSISTALPEWIRHPIEVPSEPTLPLGSLPLPNSTVEALKAQGFETALPIQNTLWRMLLPEWARLHGDLCVSAPTGSGKTLAYALPMVENLKGMPARKLRGLVVVPTRELVAQSKEVLELCARGSGLKIGTAVGRRTLREERDLLVQKGQRYDIRAYIEEKDKVVDVMEQLMDWDFDTLEESTVDEIPLLPGWLVNYTSKVDILICTPGRLVEHIKSTKGFNLHSVQWMVIDEADRLLDDSFQQWVYTLIPELEFLPPLDPLEQKLHRTFRLLRKRELRKVLLSATMTRDVSKLMALKLSKPKLVVLDNGRREDEPAAEEASTDGHVFTLPSSLTEIAVNVDDTTDKPLYLLEILERGVNLPGLSHTRSRAQPSTLANANHDGSLTSSASDDATSSSGSSISSTTNSSSSTSSTSSQIPPSNHGTLIFTSSTITTTRLTHLLTTLRPDLTPHIHAFTKYTSNRARRKALSSFSQPPSLISSSSHRPSPNLPIIITTSLLSHGIDIPSLHLVINYSIPSAPKEYIHRVGRTARAGKEGTAITLLESQQARWFWNEIARSPGIGRSGKVTRGKVEMSRWAGEERKAYERALGELGKAAQGGRRKED